MKGKIVVSDATEINSINSSPLSFDINPNPSSDRITIRTNFTAEKQVSLKILNIIGKTMIAKDNISSMEYIDISSLNKGSYFVQINYQGNSLVKKLLITR